jgi:hypothetical protein
MRPDPNPQFPFPRFPIWPGIGEGFGIPDSRFGQNRESGNPRFPIRPGTGIAGGPDLAENRRGNRVAVFFFILNFIEILRACRATSIEARISSPHAAPRRSAQRGRQVIPSLSRARDVPEEPPRRVLSYALQRRREKTLGSMNVSSRPTVGPCRIILRMVYPLLCFYPLLRGGGDRNSCKLPFLLKLKLPGVFTSADRLKLRKATCQRFAW